MTAPLKDLFILVADADTEAVIKSLLSERRDSLSIRQISFDIIRHEMRDSGVCTQSVEFLRRFQNHYTHVLVIFDLHGSGNESKDRTKIECDLESDLAKNGWDGRCSVVVINPEVEAWVWSDSPKVATILGWKEETLKLSEWLQSEGFLKSGKIKPDDPKKAFKHTLKRTDKAPSSAIFKELAKEVGLGRCVDPAFKKLKSILQKWFPST